MLIKGVMLRYFHLISLFGCVRQKDFYLRFYFGVLDGIDSVY
jgi:hypothetical protein